MVYSVLCSLTNLLEQTLNLDLEYLDVDERQQVACLLGKLRFIQDFLDNSSQKSIKTIEFLESQMPQIRDAAYKAEDIIESHVTNRVYGGFTAFFRKLVEVIKEIGHRTFCHKLMEVIREIDYIKKRVEKIEDQNEVQDQQQFSSVPAGLSKIAPSGKNTLVGFDDDLLEIKTRLVSGSSDLQTIALVGMGGIGKTTVAQKVYDDAFIIHHFHIRAWVTVSQDYNVQEILLNLLDCTKNRTNQMREASTDSLVELLYKSLKGMRYFIVMDDVWDSKFWYNARVKCVFPNDKTGSRILLTTREEKVAISANSFSSLHHLHSLNDRDSWKLFRGKIFREDCCPPELEGIGRKMVQHCRGLPLAIVVIGGLLSKLPRTQNEWKNVADNLSALMTSNDERYSKILSLSFNNLPHHIKGCFLYMGAFPEDYEINVPTLVKLWIAEGFIKTVSFKTLEQVAEEYMSDLIDRNLVMVCEKNCIGKIKTCKLHDLLRDLCVKEAKKVFCFHISSGRLGVAKFGSTSLLQRSVLHFLGECNIPSEVSNLGLRVLHNVVADPTDMLSMVNVRYFAGYFPGDRFPLSLHKLRNLQTFLLHQPESSVFCYFYMGKQIHLPPEIWNMQQLRHVQSKITLKLPDPPSAEIKGKISAVILENLQTLSLIKNFRCTLEVIKRIPNLKKLGIFYGSNSLDNWQYYCLNNLALLHKLEALKCLFDCEKNFSLKNVKFPRRLKKLTLSHGSLPWEDMTIVGSLPNLQALKLKRHSFVGSDWVPNEGEFLQLQFLLLEYVDLKHWKAESSHFPKLQRLVIKSCNYLEEIPSGIGEIDTLRSIKLHHCMPTLETSAKKLQEMHESYGNDDLQVQAYGVLPSDDEWHQDLRLLANQFSSHNSVDECDEIDTYDSPSIFDEEPIFILHEPIKMPMNGTVVYNPCWRSNTSSTTLSSIALGLKKLNFVKKGICCRMDLQDIHADLLATHINDLCGQGSLTGVE